MSMLDLLEKEISKRNLFEGNIPDIVKAVADSIPSQTITYKMKLALAISEIILFASQFRINIRHWNGSLIPINSIMFCIAKSGAAKDSSIRAARKCFESSYKTLQDLRVEDAIERAKEAAKKAGADLPNSFACYKEYLKTPNPLFIAISTAEGFIQYINDLSEEPIGSAYIQSGEFGQELASNPNLMDCVKLLSELYDEGSKEVKMIKTRETQNREIKNFPASALFLGSQDNLLFNNDIKQKFKTEFTTKLARRSFFIFINGEVPTKSYNTIEEMLEAEKHIEDTAIESRTAVSDWIKEQVLPWLLNHRGKTIDVSPEVEDLFILYKKYNEEVATTISSQYPISKLCRAHLQWKALKLAGALALVTSSEGTPIITEADYKAAVEFTELISGDVGDFEKELVKEPYEAFVDYVHSYSSNGHYSISLHNLRKLGFITSKSMSDNAVKELVRLANSCDEYGVFSIGKDTVEFEELIKSDKILVSFKAVHGTKQERAVQCASGFECEEHVFSDLEDLLLGDYAYTPFRFENGVRGKDNIRSGCKWIVMDIDSGEITDEEAHLLLEGINHYVVRTSNKDNPNKFRVLIELDTEVNLSDVQWKPFMKLIADDLGLIADGLAKSQIFFSYAGRNVLSCLDGSPLEVKQYLNSVSTIEVQSKPISKKAMSAMLDDPMTTFEKAFNAPDGEGRRKLIWSCRYARELGADREYCHTLIDRISDYWVKPLDEPSLETMHRQLDRWEF